ncbi:MAG: prepilin-type N-terminal cleavage/methylation domain-containing protein [Opitutaceae bacterium]|nr:prepilin-type N-terminal cleavage/methylation domain-containing protein [Opitutaceae bacterium]
MWAGRQHNARRGARAFSLVELLISLSLVMMLTLALLTSYLFIVRGDRSLQNYGEMNAQARKMLELLGQDLRAATDVTNFTTSTLSLTLPTNTAATTTQDVMWEYNSVDRTVSRQDNSGTATLARDVETFIFYYANGNNATTTSLVEVKQVQLSLRMLRLVAQSVTSEYVISAQYTMRAKSTAH